MIAGPVREFAPAKVNLALCVTGRRADGYHELDSIVVFATVGDWIEAKPGSDLRLAVTGPRSLGIPVEDNLVLKAAAALSRSAARRGLGARLVLDKALPMAAGIGGGSSDAAAALRALNRLWRLDLGTQELMAIGARIGADLPACVYGASARIRGIGEVVTPLTGLPELHLVLANPGRGLSTASVFARLGQTDNPGLAEPIGPFKDPPALAAYLSECRNDLERPAIEAEPTIAAVLAALAGQPGCLVSRMSGSGASCFGIFADAELAIGAARQLAAMRPDWWVVAARTLVGERTKVLEDRT